LTAKYAGAEILYTGDRGLAKAAESEGLKSVSPLTVFPLAGLGLRVGSLASPTPHGPPSSPTPWGSHLCLATTAPLTPVRITRGLYPLILSPPKLKYLLFSCRTVATSHTVFDSSPNTITPDIHSYLQLFRSTVSSVTAYNQDYFENVGIGGLGGAVNILKAGYSMGGGYVNPA